MYLGQVASAHAASLCYRMLADRPGVKSHSEASKNGLKAVISMRFTGFSDANRLKNLPQTEDLSEGRP